MPFGKTRFQGDKDQSLNGSLEDAAQMGYYTRALFQKLKSPEFMRCWGRRSVDETAIIWDAALRLDK